MTKTNVIAHPSNAAAMDLTIRRATERDAAGLVRLAALDSRSPLAGACLVAEVGGELWAARSLQTGEVAADPFRPTADLLALLHERARHLDGGTAPARRSALSRLAATLRPWHAGARSG
jgi:hypothetical protein